VEVLAPLSNRTAMLETLRLTCSHSGCDRKVEAPAPEPDQIDRVQVVHAMPGPDGVRVLPNLIFKSGPLEGWVLIPAFAAAQCPEHSETARALAHTS